MDASISFCGGSKTKKATHMDKKGVHMEKKAPPHGQKPPITWRKSSP